MRPSLTHLERLESQSLHIFREVIATTKNPVLLYSIGKDSTVLLHLALKAFAPSSLPFPVLHIDTGWKFKEMIAFRDAQALKLGLNLIVHINPEGLRDQISPVTHGSNIHTRIMKTEALRQALDQYGFDAAFGGARRDEEKSRAKERIISIRSHEHVWDPKNQRPELWSLYNTRLGQGETLRAFPLSNWTEADIWAYIRKEKLDIVPLYFAKERPTIERDGQILLQDDERLTLLPGEEIRIRMIRFRTLGCYPLTAATLSNASTVDDIVAETLGARTSERAGRLIDQDETGSMEKKKKEGYF